MKRISVVLAVALALAGTTNAAEFTTDIPGAATNICSVSGCAFIGAGNSLPVGSTKRADLVILFRGQHVATVMTIARGIDPDKCDQTARAIESSADVEAATCFPQR